MSRSLNKVMLIGNVGSDPEIRTTGGGTKVAKVSLATNRTYQDRSGQQQEKTDWHRLTFWDKLADVVERYVKKGDKLYIEGRIEYSQSEDDKGQVRYYTDIQVREMVMLSGAGGGQEGGGFEGSSGPRRRASPAPGGARPPSSPFESDDDDLPF